jgi:hypothetical protein
LILRFKEETTTMPRGGYRPGAGRPRKTPPALDQARVNRAARDAGMTPLQFMLRLMRDESADITLRCRMAIAAAPFVHAKAADVGKRAQAAADAETAGDGSEWGDDLTAH